MSEAQDKALELLNTQDVVVVGARTANKLVEQGLVEIVRDGVSPGKGKTCVRLASNPKPQPQPKRKQRTKQGLTVGDGNDVILNEKKIGTSESHTYNQETGFHTFKRCKTEQRATDFDLPWFGNSWGDLDLLIDEESLTMELRYSESGKRLYKKKFNPDFPHHKRFGK